MNFLYVLNISKVADFTCLWAHSHGNSPRPMWAWVLFYTGMPILPEPVSGLQNVVADWRVSQLLTLRCILNHITLGIFFSSLLIDGCQDNSIVFYTREALLAAAFYSWCLLYQNVNLCHQKCLIYGRTLVWDGGTQTIQEPCNLICFAVKAATTREGTYVPVFNQP